MRIDDGKERNFYEIESSKNNWSLGERQRQCDTAFYTRLSLSRNQDEILELSTKSGAVVQFTLPENNEHIFASKYSKILTSKEKLKQLIEA